MITVTFTVTATAESDAPRATADQIRDIVALATQRGGTFNPDTNIIASGTATLELGKLSEWDAGKMISFLNSIPRTDGGDQI